MAQNENIHASPQQTTRLRVLNRMYHPKHDEVKAVQKLYAAERKSHEDTLKNILGEISLMRHNTQEAAKILFHTTKKLDGLIELLLTIQGKEEPNSGK